MITYSTYLEQTLQHIRRVQDNMVKVVAWIESEENLDFVERVTKSFHDSINIPNLLERAIDHDQSKFKGVELEGYRKALNDDNSIDMELLGDAWDVHRTINDHHPDAWTGGLKKMSKNAVIEMLCDWEAAQFREAGNDMQHTKKMVERIGNTWEIDEQTQNSFIVFIHKLRQT